MATLKDIVFPSEDHKAFFKRLMDDYANSGKGMIFALPLGSKHGDCALETNYHWRTEQLSAWREHQTIPAKLSDLDGSVALLTLVYIVPTVYRADDNDVRITKATFDRLEETSTAMAIMMPVSPDEEQKKAYRDGSINDQNALMFGDCLKPGFRPEDMVMGADGRMSMPGVAAIHLATAGELVQSMGDSS